MWEFFGKLFDSDFMPHGHCFFWRPELVWLHVSADALIMLAYYSIPLSLLYFIRRRKDLAFSWMFVLFSVFIFACGTTHALNIWTLWVPTYRLDGVVKLLTAGVSVGTAVLLVRFIPQALALPSPEQLDLANRALKYEMAERQRAEETLRAHETPFRRLLESAPDGVVIVDRGGHIILVNTRAEAMFGYQREELLGQPVELLLPERFRNAHGIHRSGYYANPGVRPMGSGLNLAGRRRDGTEFPVEISLSPLETEEGVLVTSVIRDVSARHEAEAALRESEERFRGAFDDAAIGMMLVAPNGCFMKVNQAFCAMLGYSEEELLDTSFVAITHPGDIEGTFEHLGRLLADESRTSQFEKRYLHKRGRIVWGLVNVSLVRNAIGKPLYFVAQLQDVTERRAVERMKDEFISVVSHELRTPLTSIRGSLGLLAGDIFGALPEKGRRMLEIAVSNADRLVRLINDILDIERIESGKVAMQKQVVNTTNLMTQAVEIIRSMADRAQVTLEVTSVLAVPVWVDPDRIVQTLTNLLSNAVKFSPSGATVWLSAERRGQHIVFQVRDQGRGIPADKLESIFERFQQVDASDSRAKGGTGLGLAICRSIVQQHGGLISVQSEVGKGSTFFFSLPVESLESRVPIPASRFPAPAPFLPLDRSPALADEQLVLVCDDESWNRSAAQTLLQRWGYRVVTVASGQEAVDQAVLLHPLVILLDLQMPGMDGWETMAALKERAETRDIPVIITSSLSPTDSVLSMTDAIEWLVKPLDAQTLSVAVGRVWQRMQDGVLRVLIVEDDDDLAGVLVATFKRHGIETLHARTQEEAVQICSCTVPSLLVLDLILPDGNGFAIVDWLRRHNRLRSVPLVVYSGRELAEGERKRLHSENTLFLNKGRTMPEEFERQVVALLNRVVRGEGAPTPDVSIGDAG